jgi:CelD/BcsL family acetyltransferase involved in cellulose biosynthesis
LYVLRLNGRIIAAQLAAVCDTHIEWMIAGFDAELWRLSPGVILNEFCLRWAFDRKLNCSLGLGREANKVFWSKGLAHEIATFQVVNSRWGRVAYEARRAFRMAKSRANHLR